MTKSETYGEAYAPAALFYTVSDKLPLADYSACRLNASPGKDKLFFLEANHSDDSGKGGEFQRYLSLRKNYIPGSNLPSGILEMELIPEHYDDETEIKKERWTRPGLLIPKQVLKSNIQ